MPARGQFKNLHRAMVTSASFCPLFDRPPIMPLAMFSNTSSACSRWVGANPPARSHWWATPAPAVPPPSQVMRPQREWVTPLATIMVPPGNPAQRMMVVAGSSPITLTLVLYFRSRVLVMRYVPAGRYSTSGLPSPPSSLRALCSTAVSSAMPSPFAPYMALASAQLANGPTNSSCARGLEAAGRITGMLLAMNAMAAATPAANITQTSLLREDPIPETSEYLDLRRC